MGVTGLEPVTPWMSFKCSTNWAKRPTILLNYLTIGLLKWCINLPIPFLILTNAFDFFVLWYISAIKFLLLKLSFTSFSSIPFGTSWKTGSGTLLLLLICTASPIVSTGNSANQIFYYSYYIYPFTEIKKGDTQIRTGG